MKQFVRITLGLCVLATASVLAGSDVERTNRLVPVLGEDCTKEPSTSYWAKRKQEFKKTL